MAACNSGNVLAVVMVSPFISLETTNPRPVPAVLYCRSEPYQNSRGSGYNSKRLPMTELVSAVLTPFWPHIQGSMVLVLFGFLLSLLHHHPIAQKGLNIIRTLCQYRDHSRLTGRCQKVNLSRPYAVAVSLNLDCQNG